MKLSSGEYLDLAFMLEDYHKVFYTFWTLSSVSYCDSIKTAAVCFPDGSKPYMLINGSWWNALSTRERLFVICHECLHVILDHGIRNGMNVPGATHRLVNVAQDITINEMIVRMFKFEREELSNWEKYCWIDTCFKDPLSVKRNETFIYYLMLLIEENRESEITAETLDDHSGQSGQTEVEKDSKDRLSEELAADLEAEELEALKNALGGEHSSGIEKTLKNKKADLKIKFTHIIRKLKKTSIKESFKDIETFSHDDRRFSEVLSSKNTALPGRREDSFYEKDRLLTAIFMDVSGSCVSYFSFFESVFAAFDREREIFDTLLYTFDTKVKPVRQGQKIYVGGGTKFDIIEETCIKLESQFHRYPDCVIVITDGEGNTVKPKAPKKWVWLLTEGGTHTYIPKSSRSFYLKQLTF